MAHNNVPQEYTQQRGAIGSVPKKMEAEMKQSGSASKGKHKLSVSHAMGKKKHKKGNPHY